jgi:hypothetical protein
VVILMVLIGFRDGVSFYGLLACDGYVVGDAAFGV